jgi:hypothetical protein
MNRMKLSATSANIGAPRTISFVMPVTPGNPGSVAICFLRVVIDYLDAVATGVSDKGAACF